MARGAHVHLIAGPTSVPAPTVTTFDRVRTAAQMHAAVTAAAVDADVVIMAAAVADYTPAKGAHPNKLEKGGDVTLALERTIDILAELGQRRASGADTSWSPVLVGFAAETGPAEARAATKLKHKQVDLIVANDVSAEGAGFDVDTNQVTLVSAQAPEPLPLMSKADVSAAILDRVETMLDRL